MEEEPEIEHEEEEEEEGGEEDVEEDEADEGKTFREIICDFSFIFVS